MMETKYRIYADGAIVHQDDFNECDERYDDFYEVTVPDILIMEIQSELVTRISNLEKWTTDCNNDILETVSGEFSHMGVSAQKLEDRFKELMK